MEVMESREEGKRKMEMKQDYGRNVGGKRRNGKRRGDKMMLQKFYNTLYGPNSCLTLIS